jgi:hypothetical protein
MSVGENVAASLQLFKRGMPDDLPRLSVDRQFTHWSPLASGINQVDRYPPEAQGFVEPGLLRTETVGKVVVKLPTESDVQSLLG